MLPEESYGGHEGALANELLCVSFREYLVRAKREGMLVRQEKGERWVDERLNGEE